MIVLGPIELCNKLNVDTHQRFLQHLHVHDFTPFISMEEGHSNMGDSQISYTAQVMHMIVHKHTIVTLRFLCLNVRKVSLVAICTVI